jgi:hypothetical protein
MNLVTQIHDLGFYFIIWTNDLRKIKTLCQLSSRVGTLKVENVMSSKHFETILGQWVSIVFLNVSFFYFLTWDVDNGTKGCLWVVLPICCIQDHVHILFVSSCLYNELNPSFFNLPFLAFWLYCIFFSFLKIVNVKSFQYFQLKGKGKQNTKNV